jgi:hypothetical protein
VGTCSKIQSEDVNVSSDSENEVNINFSPWIPFTDDKEIPVRQDWLVSIVNPLNEIKKIRFLFLRL